MLKKYTVGLTNDEEKALIELVTRGTAKARAIQRAHILLLAGEGKIDTEIAEMVRCHQESVTKVRRRFKERGGGGEPERPAASRREAQAGWRGRGAAGRRRLQRRPRRSEPLDDAAAGRPTGHDRRREHDQRRDRPSGFNKQKIKLWQTRQWCIGEVNAEFLARMEALLEHYARPYDPAEPVVCFDECPVQLLGEAYAALPAEPAKPRRQDYEYVRGGTACLLACVEPLAAWRHVEVSEQRTKRDFARCMNRLVNERYPDAREIHVVLDNLNTHTLGTLYEAFPAAGARAIVRKLRFHYTPVHGSWLNMTEIEFSVLSRDCLTKRIATIDALSAVVDAWQDRRNGEHASITWRFTTDDARDKFHRFYPVVS